MFASAPWILPFAGWLWPAGPERVTVLARELGGGQRSRVTDPERALTLLVDPSLPAPAADEGPLACEAAALRAVSPPRAVELISRGPRAPIPGADAARALAVRRALGGLFPSGANPAEDGPIGSGRVWPHEGGFAPVAPEARLLELLDGRLVMYEDLVSRLRGEPAAPPEPTAPLERLAAWLDAARGRGLGAPTRSPRACDLERVLAAAGMIARWPLGSGLVLVLCEPGARQGLVAALGAHGLAERALRLGGTRGVWLEKEAA